MDHENFEQHIATLEDGTQIFISLCTCGKGFWDEDADLAHAKWEQHEADNY